MSIRLDNFLQEGYPRSQGGSAPRTASTWSARSNTQRESFSAKPSAATSPSEPMDVNVSTFRTQERERRRIQGLCFYCGEGQHQIRQCPNRRSQEYKSQPSPTVSSPSVKALALISFKVQIRHANQVYLLSALIDSGSSGNFIDWSICEHFNLPLRKLNNPQLICAIDGAPVGNGAATHCTLPITMHVSCLHKENISVLVTESPKHNIVLGIPWLH